MWARFEWYILAVVIGSLLIGFGWHSENFWVSGTGGFIVGFGLRELKDYLKGK